MWLSEHVQSRYAAGLVIVIPPGHRGYEHTVRLPLFVRLAAPAYTDAPNPRCVTLRGSRVCDCGMYALDWTTA